MALVSSPLVLVVTIVSLLAPQRLLDHAADAARWLGYLPFDSIRDQRNQAPELHLTPHPTPPWVGVDFDIEVEFPTDVAPTVYVSALEALQPYQLVLWGEKASLSEVLLPIAQRYEASLAIPTGDASETMVYTVCEHMARDGRPAVILYFSDFDPSGYQMAISVSRKIQAHGDLRFPDLTVQVRQVALTQGQVRTYNLPSTPLKEGEKRRAKWMEAFKHEQTEIDALAALRPDLLRQLAEEAIAPFYDRTLQGRCTNARSEYWTLAHEAFQDQADVELLDTLRARAEATLDEMRDRIQALREEMRSATDEVDLNLGLPEPVVPQGVVDGEPTGEVVFDSTLPWAKATKRMKDRKAYVDAAGGG